MLDLISVAWRGQIVGIFLVLGCATSDSATSTGKPSTGSGDNGHETSHGHVATGTDDPGAAEAESSGSATEGTACLDAPTFAIELGPGSFAKQIVVFGVPVYATSQTQDIKVRHAAEVLAQYLDNDEDCVVDDPAVVSAMLDRDAAIIMAPTEDQLPLQIEGQPLFGDETHPNGAAQGLFDATLEETLHLVTSLGYAGAYPADFGEAPGTTLTEAMDLARGGYFETIPDPYPPQAWYHYDDPTCDYRCMAAEYIYWALTTWLGAQEFAGRCEEIAVEWELCTPAALKARDPAIYALLTDARYRVPTVLPDGSYRSN